MNPTLLEKISSPDRLLYAWQKLDKHNLESHGLSGVSIKTFSDNIGDKVTSISADLLKGKFKFSANRAVLIPKSNGKFRPLQVPEIQDRLVLKSIAIHLEEIFQETIDKSKGISFAYQKGLGIKDAVDSITKHIDAGNVFVLECDMINFFGEVNKEKLLSELIYPRLPDTSINQLIHEGLNQEIGGLDKITQDKRHYFDNVKQGIPQGNSLSPLLSNIYLSPFDLKIKSKNYNLVRYADDFIVLCNTHLKCESAYTACIDALKSLDLKIHERDSNNAKSSKIVDLSRESFSFLSITFDGKTFFPSRFNVDYFKAKVSEICNKNKIEHTALSLLNKVQNTLDGWVSAFYYTNVEVYSKEIDSHINKQLYLGLAKLDWKFRKSSLGKVPSELRKKKASHDIPDCLSDIQRANSGVINIDTLLKLKRVKILTREPKEEASQL
jgi:RNA-directed DNA polymerase